MKHHDKNLDEFVEKIRERLAAKIAQAEQEHELPDEAIMLSMTQTIVFFGNHLERKRLKRDWIEKKTAGLPTINKKQLRDQGKCVAMTEFKDNNAESWTVWETVDVHMSESARERLESKAFEESVKKDRDLKKQADDLPDEAPRKKIITPV